jgi:nucleotide-binding universal stress UspA family protein
VILVATDGSDSAEAATGTALELARALGDRLLVVTVWRELRGDFGVSLHAVLPDAAEIEKDHAREVADGVVARAKTAGIEAEAIVRHGTPWREICSAVADHDPRMVVIGCQGWGRMERAVFGSVSESVLHHAKCPVLVVPSVTS